MSLIRQRYPFYEEKLLLLSNPLYGLVATIPCHNEAEYLREAVYELKRKIEEFETNYVIVIAEDGSTDGSTEISMVLASQNRRVIHIHADSKLGRGKAIKNAWSDVKGDIYAYIDCDLATDMRFFHNLVQHIREGYDLATGSRYMEGAVCDRPFLRRLSSRAYNTLINLLFRDGVKDHQCGFKAFSRRMVNHLLRESYDNDWFWDTEAIVLAHRDGFRIKEFPIVWTEKRRKRTSLKRLFKDIWIHSRGILSFRFR